MGTEAASIPKIKFSGLVPGTPDWDAVEAEVMKALETYGCFEALYDDVTPQLREALFGHSPEVFSLPSEVKKASKEYVDRLAEFAHEVILVEEEEITKHILPQGDSSFTDVVSAYKNLMKELEQMIVRMVFHSLGIENYVDSYIQSVHYEVRMSAYGVPYNQITKLSLQPHIDPNLFTFVCQHQVEGLEVKTREGEWICVPPLPNSFTVVTGEALQGWSNGRLQPVTHRVRVLGKEKRYSVLFSSIPNDDYVIKTPEELVNEDHPLLYKPFTYGEYMKLRFSRSILCTLKDLCGTDGEEVQA